MALGRQLRDGGCASVRWDCVSPLDESWPRRLGIWTLKPSLFFSISPNHLHPNAHSHLTTTNQRKPFHNLPRPFIPQPISTKMDPKTTQARETLSILHEISLILNTGLDRETLSLCISLCESGVNPEALAMVIKHLRRESRSFRRQEQNLNAAGEGSA